MKIKVFVLLILFCTAIRAQVTITNDTPVNLVNLDLLGGGLTASGIISQGDASQFARFTAAPGTPIGFSSGIILSTFSMTSPDIIQTTGPGYFSAGTAGDTLLSSIIGGDPTNNAAIIQFDFIPTGDTIKFDYIFASTEYNFYVNSSFNDVFAFTINGPIPGGGTYVNQNLAIIPGTSLPVSINNLNNGMSAGCATGPCEYCTYYIDNCTPPVNGISTGGYTTALTAIAPVIPCSTYTIRLAVADVVDGALNSMVFLKENSFSSNLVTLSSEVTFGPNDTLLVEGCNDAYFSFVRLGDTSVVDTVSFTVTGTATMGADYNPLPPFAVFPAGEDTVQFFISPIEDGINEPIESITISVNYSVCGASTSTTLTLAIKDVDTVVVTTTPNDTICEGENVFFDAWAVGGLGIYTINWETPNNIPFIDSTSFAPTQTGYYVVDVYEQCTNTNTLDSVYVNVFRIPNLPLSPLIACSGVGEILGPNINLPGYDFAWSPATNLSSSNIFNPVFTGTNSGAGPIVFNYTLTLDSAGVSCYSEPIVVNLYPNPVLNLPSTAVVCEASNIVLDPAASPTGAHLWESNATLTTTTLTVSNPGTYDVIVTTSQGCVGTDSTVVTLDSLPHFTIQDIIICDGDTGRLFVDPNEGTGFSWSNGATSPEIFVTAAGQYILTVTNSCGNNSDTAEVVLKPNLTTVVLPNIFTPNNDGVNDEYQILSLIDAEAFTIEFYNRWGVKVYETTDFNKPWDGTIDTNPAEPGVYFVVLKAYNCNNEEIIKQGFIQLFN